MNLVDEKNVAGPEFGENADQVRAFGERRAVGDVNLGVHFMGDHVGQGRLAEPRGPVEENMLDRLLAALAASTAIFSRRTSASWPIYWEKFSGRSE